MAVRPTGLVSAVALITRDEDLAKIQELASTLTRLGIAHEIIGCASMVANLDSSAVSALCSSTSNLAIYTISTDSGDSVLSAGLEFALGDWVLELPTPSSYTTDARDLLATENSSPSLDLSFQIIPTRRPLRDHLLSWFASRALGIRVNTLLQTSRLSSRQSLMIWNRRKLRHKVIRVAPQLALISVEPVESQRSNEASTKRLVRIGLRTVVHATPKPLRWVSLISFFGAGVSVLSSLTILIVGVERKVVAGWTTTNLQLSWLSFLTLTVLSILSEYIYQIAAATIEQPTYRVTSETISGHYGFKQEANLERSIRIEPPNNE